MCASAPSFQRRKSANRDDVTKPRDIVIPGCAEITGNDAAPHPPRAAGAT